MTDEEKLNALLKEKDKLDNKISKLKSKIRIQRIKNCLHQYEEESGGHNGFFEMCNKCGHVK